MTSERPAPADALAYLAERSALGIKFGLETMRALLGALGHPERVPTLLVAGTNGKGSVVAYADAALRAGGLRVGRYVSPHLQRVNERIAVDGDEIPDAALAEAVGRVRDAAERLQRSGGIPAHPTYFETLTAAALDHFRCERVAVALLEVGLGGRLDATNATSPVASAIVSVAHDHESFLGGSLEQIATEKAGVLRPGRATVLGPLAAGPRAAIGTAAAAIGARLVDAARGASVGGAGATVDVITPLRAYRGLRPLIGRHQWDNLLVAIRLVEEAAAAGLVFDPEAAGAGASDARWPGRLQWIPGAPPLLLDGAHNPAAARALAEHLRGIGPYVLLFGAMADKDVAGIARPLLERARAVVLCRPRTGRAATPEQIAARTGAAAAELQPDVAAGLARARALAGTERPVVVAGSLYLVGEVLDQLAGERP